MIFVVNHEFLKGSVFSARFRWVAGPKTGQNSDLKVFRRFSVLFVDQVFGGLMLCFER